MEIESFSTIYLITSIISGIIGLIILICFIYLCINVSRIRKSFYLLSMLFLSRDEKTWKCPLCRTEGIPNATHSCPKCNYLINELYVKLRSE